MNNNHIFWTSDPSILYKQYLDFFPKSSMTRIEQLNAITRLCIYFLILAFVLNKSDFWIQLPIIVVVFIVILHYFFDKDKAGISEEINKTQKDEQFANNPEIQSGYYDSDNKLIVDKYNGSNNKNKKVHYSFTDYQKYKNKTCKIPTVDNPFMNPNANEFEMENPPEACNVDDEDIENKITECFNNNLYMDVSDLFEKENSQRQFFTVPQMNPPDQTAFAKWLYGDNANCKVDQSKCLRYEDLRYARGFSDQQNRF